MGAFKIPSHFLLLFIEEHMTEMSVWKLEEKKMLSLLFFSGGQILKVKVKVKMPQCFDLVLG